jgi:hypothetical protein
MSDRQALIARLRASTQTLGSFCPGELAGLLTEAAAALEQSTPTRPDSDRQALVAGLKEWRKDAATYGHVARLKLIDRAIAALEQGTPRERNECNECGLVGRHDNACEGAPSEQFAMAMLPASAQDVCVQLAQRYFADSKSVVALVDLFAAAWCSGRDWSPDAAPPLPRDERPAPKMVSAIDDAVFYPPRDIPARDEDARRYRLLRSLIRPSDEHPERSLRVVMPDGNRHTFFDPDKLDTAIDAAIAEQERGGKT